MLGLGDLLRSPDPPSSLIVTLPMTNSIAPQSASNTRETHWYERETRTPVVHIS